MDLDHSSSSNFYQPGAIFKYKKLSDPDGPLQSCSEDEEQLDPSSGHFSIVKRCNVLDSQGNPTGAQVAVKMLKIKSASRGRNLDEDEDLQTRMTLRLEREYSLHRTLNHRNIAPLLGKMAIPEQNLWYLVTPWYRYGTVRSFLKKMPGYEFRLLCDATKGVAYLHSENIVHGDIKSTNVLVDNGGRAVIIDFGVSFVAVPPPAELNSSNMAAAPQWLAPELHYPIDQEIRTFETDIWAFGCLTLEVYTNENPFKDIQTGSVAHHLNNPDERLRLLPGSPGRYFQVPADSPMWELCYRCWRRNPSDRPNIRGVLDYLDASDHMMESVSP
ncbi:hypothetical protein FRC03_003397 [Tulasnella sp. 419]|nr:hypothetical protein FRC03_003397 [Tulasnella sp. 419]